MDKMREMTISRMVDYIQRHYIPCVYSPQRDRIRAIERYSTLDDRKNVNRIVDIPPTMGDISLFLGY